MIPFLPEMPAGSPSAPGLILPGTATPQDPASAGAGLDFAGLLDAALPMTVEFAPPAPGGSVPRQPLLSETGGDGADPAERALPTATFAAPMPALPTGKILPGPDAKLPQVAPAPLPPVAVPSVHVESEPAFVEALNSAPSPDDLLTGEAPAPLMPGTGDQTEAPAPANPLDIALAEAPSPDPALVAAALTPALAMPLPIIRGQRVLVTPGSGGEELPLPAHVTLPQAPSLTPATPVVESPPAAAATASDPAAVLPAPGAAPQSAPTPPQALAVPHPAAAPTSALPERIDTARPPAPQQETAIAQFGELREVLRSARPEMTLRHAEFGAVSLRLEATGASDWRAVLASRDPGFVPAIQAALAERAVTAASASADSGGLFMGQNGTSDQRYGASPNGGQGGLSPYMGQSGDRDGEAAPDHRRPSTAAALAARGQDGEGDGSGSETRGLFA